MQLEVVWNLLLKAGSEGPTLISCDASWRTFCNEAGFLKVPIPFRFSFETITNHGPHPGT